MLVDGPRYSPGTPVRVADRSASRAPVAILEYPLHEHYGDVGWVTAVEETPRTAKYEVSFDPYGDDRLVFEEAELEPAPPRKT